MANKKKSKLSNELRSLQLQRKRALGICLIGVAGIVVILVVRRALVLSGILLVDETISDTIVFVLCLATALSSVAKSRFVLALEEGSKR